MNSIFTFTFSLTPETNYRDYEAQYLVFVGKHVTFFTKTTTGLTRDLTQKSFSSIRGIKLQFNTYPILE